MYFLAQMSFHCGGHQGWDSRLVATVRIGYCNKQTRFTEMLSNAPLKVLRVEGSGRHKVADMSPSLVKQKR